MAGDNFSGALSAAGTANLRRHPATPAIAAWRSRADRLWPAACAGAGLLFAAVAQIGGTRQFGFDEAVSFGYYVATPSPFDVFGRSHFLGVPLWVIATNNHPLFNFLEHLLWLMTGAHVEWLYRELPVLFGAVSVALVGVLLRPALGSLAAAAGMLFLATSPLFDDQAHQMRGYTLLLLLVLLSVVTLWQRRGRLLAVLVGLGVLTHLYFVLALPGLAVLAHRRRSLRWALPYLSLGAAAGLAAYAGVAADMLHHSRDQGQIWRPDFPLQLVGALLGGPWLNVVALCFPIAMLGLVAGRRERALWALLALYIAVAAAVWVVARPAELYPRFFFFLLPGVAWLVAAAVHRWRVLIAVVLLAAGVSVWQQRPGWTQDQIANRSAAAVLSSEPGGCVISHDELVVAAYTRSYRIATYPAQLADCRYVVAVSWALLPPVVTAVQAEFPVRQELPANYPGYVLRRA